MLFYDVELWHLDDEPELSWSAEGAIRGDSSGVRFESTDTFAELVADVVDEVRETSQARGGTAIGVTWYMAELIDDAEGAERMAHELAAAEGVELPARPGCRPDQRVRSGRFELRTSRRPAAKAVRLGADRLRGPSVRKQPLILAP
ncbi:MAG TPA: hypothetical protein VNO31_22935 [Umezawaea sp.]|nr:hypothetical protein [Umezawaea sp.]